MSFQEVIGQIIDAKNKETEKMIITTGIVKNVRQTLFDVSREGLPDLLGVRLHALVKSPDDFIRIVPKKDSVVLCGIIENNRSEAVVIAYSEIEKVVINIKGAEFSMENGKFTIKNDSADLKEIINTGFDTLSKAIITTPSGPGSFSPDDILKFEELKLKTTKLFS